MTGKIKKQNNIPIMGKSANATLTQAMKEHPVQSRSYANQE